MTRWREWVIDAFNNNLPFDQFTVEQLAGDLLPNATIEQKIASGFNRNHMINFEGGAIPEEYLNAYIVDRVNTTATVWLGLTVACAQCHDHKYDPITQKEFYQLYAFFNNVPESGLDGSKGNAVPMIKTPTKAQLDAIAKLDARIKALEATKPPPPDSARILMELRKEKKDLEAKFGSTMVMQEMAKPRDTFLLLRGEYDKKGEKVTAGVPAFLPPLPKAAPSNRLGLARWLVDPDAPADEPGHRQSLLATLLRHRPREDGRGLRLSGRTAEPSRIARLARGRVLLSASRQACLECARVRSHDRHVGDLPAIVGRYQAASGQRSRESPAGPRPAFSPASRVHPRPGAGAQRPAEPRDRRPQRQSVSTRRPVAGARLAQDSKNWTRQFFVQSHGQDLYRRTMYTFWKRTSPPPQLVTFDAPDREVCTVRRSRTNTPLQALILMNDPTYVEAAQVRRTDHAERKGARSSFSVRVAPCDGACSNGARGRDPQASPRQATPDVPTKSKARAGTAARRRIAARRDAIGARVGGIHDRGEHDLESG